MFRVVIKNAEEKIQRVYLVDQYRIVTDPEWEFCYVWNGSSKSYELGDGYTLEIYYTVNQKERIDSVLVYSNYLDMVQLEAGEEQ